MPALLLGAALLIAVLVLAKLYVSADPRLLVRLTRRIGGAALLVFAAFLASRGALALALPVGAGGLGLLGWSFGPAGFGARTQRSRGQTSRVRSAVLEMELDHDSGAIRGRIHTGPHAGADLDTLSVTELAALLPGLDADSLTLLTAYLDHRDPEWRAHTAQDTANGGPQTGAPPRGAAMTEAEARQILGVSAGAGAEEIAEAHRALMKKLHPDHGGSNYFAAKLNEARDVLMRGQG